MYVDCRQCILNFDIFNIEGIDGVSSEFRVGSGGHPLYDLVGEMRDLQIFDSDLVPEDIRPCPVLDSPPPPPPPPMPPLSWVHLTDTGAGKGTCDATGEIGSVTGNHNNCKSHCGQLPSCVAYHRDKAQDPPECTFFSQLNSENVGLPDNNFRCVLKKLHVPPPSPPTFTSTSTPTFTSSTSTISSPTFTSTSTISSPTVSSSATTSFRHRHLATTSFSTTA